MRVGVRGSQELSIGVENDLQLSKIARQEGRARLERIPAITISILNREFGSPEGWNAQD